MVNDIKLLDCTLRDGGYINEWKWGFLRARAIVRSLVRAQVDVVEVGFLRNVEKYDRDITVCNDIDELNALLPDDRGQTIFSAMAMRSNYDINRLKPYSGQGIEMIRITAHDYDIWEGMDFARSVKERGYKLSINPINIMGYTDKEILSILETINEIMPYQFSIVDTFGSMRRRDLERIVGVVDNNLQKNIRVALHLHENMSLGTYLAQDFIDMHLQRPIAIDGSLMGMGRNPGNLPIELIADYMNDYAGKKYDLDLMMDAIEDYIIPLKGKTLWGYTPAFFLSARFNLHRNYAEYFLNKGDLTNRDINHILARIELNKKTVFDAAYADKLYEEYMNNGIDDSSDRESLAKKMRGRELLVLAPGQTIRTSREKIQRFVEEKRPVVVAVNFIPEGIVSDYIFFSNNKRLNQINLKDATASKVIVTSNFLAEHADYVIDYNSLCGAFDQGCNSLIMLLKLLKDFDVHHVYIAGADGYKLSGENYFDESMRSTKAHGVKFNDAVSSALRRLELPISFLTPTEYDVS